jgi:hypothetical protein
MSDTEIAVVKEMHDRLIAVEGKTLALTYLLRRLITLKVLPSAEVDQLIGQMHDLATPDEFSKAVVHAAQGVLTALIDKTTTEGPTLSLIQGGKVDPPEGAGV